MVISLDKLRQMLAEFERIFPEPDPNAKIEDAIGCFADIFPKDKSSVDFIREERAKMFGLDGVEEDD